VTRVLPPCIVDLERAVGGPHAFAVKSPLRLLAASGSKDEVSTMWPVLWPAAACRAERV